MMSLLFSPVPSVHLIIANDNTQLCVVGEQTLVRSPLSQTNQKEKGHHTTPLFLYCLNFHTFHISHKLLYSAAKKQRNKEQRRINKRVAFTNRKRETFIRIRDTPWWIGRVTALYCFFETGTPRHHDWGYDGSTLTSEHHIVYTYMETFFFLKKRESRESGERALATVLVVARDPNLLWYIHSPCDRPLCRSFDAVLERGLFLSLLFTRHQSLQGKREGERAKEGRGGIVDWFLFFSRKKFCQMFM